MSKSGLRFHWSFTMISILIGFILLISFKALNTHAQFLFPPPSDYLSLFALQILSSPLVQSPLGISLQRPINHALALQAINSGFYPNANYLVSSTVPGASTTPYISNTTGYYTIESSSACTCNLP